MKQKSVSQAVRLISERQWVSGSSTSLENRTEGCNARTGKSGGKSHRKLDKLYVASPFGDTPISEIIMHCNQSSAALEKSETLQESKVRPAHPRASKTTGERHTASLDARSSRPSTRQACDGHARRRPRRADLVDSNYRLSAKETQIAYIARLKPGLFS